MKIGHFQIAMLNSNASEMGQGEVYRIELMSFLRAYIVIKTVLATNTQAEISHTSEDIERDKF